MSNTRDVLNRLIDNLQTKATAAIARGQEHYDRAKAGISTELVQDNFRQAGLYWREAAALMDAASMAHKEWMAAE